MTRHEAANQHQQSVPGMWESAVEGDLAQELRDRSGESYAHRSSHEFEIVTRRTQALHGHTDLLSTQKQKEVPTCLCGIAR